MSAELVYTMAQFREMLAEEREAGRVAGRAEGAAEGYDEAQGRLVARLEVLLQERSGSKYDAARPVLLEAIARCSATVADVTPRGGR